MVFFAPSVENIAELIGLYHITIHANIITYLFTIWQMVEISILSGGNKENIL